MQLYDDDDCMALDLLFSRPHKEPSHLTKWTLTPDPQPNSESKSADAQFL